MRDVLTEQNRHPRVHVSPMSIMVAVADDLDDPPQQSEIFGQRASSQTDRLFVQWGEEVRKRMTDIMHTSM